MSACKLVIRTMLAAAAVGSLCTAAERPNILWITAEDMSPTLGCYGDNYALTPNIDKFATQSVRYTNAFATAPVCSPSRSCLINGVYAPSQGTHNMRSAFPIPETLAGFPSLLRRNGYFTSNQVKTDYNSANWIQIIDSSWDECRSDAHWRDRQRLRPFFSVFNLMTSHQSRTMVWPPAKFEAEVQSQLDPREVHSPADAPLPPYYPDTPIVRKTVARYYDCVTAMDKQVGRLLEQLDEDGLADDTVVFFYSDHGSGMPRHKRALLDSGMRVPLLVRFPARYQHLAPGRAGETIDRLVSFVDFAPTVLALAGIPIPEHMQGHAFLGRQQATPRDHVFGHRDRVDEVLDMARSVRNKQFLYIRNYMPHLGYNQPSAWPDQGKIRHEFYRLADARTMTAPQWHFAGPTRPVEEMYDCGADPQNLKNLAELPEYRSTRDELRDALRSHLIATTDLGFIPEAQMWQRIADGTTPMELAEGFDDRYRQQLIAAASLVGVADEARLIAGLQDEDETVRYWAAVGLCATDKLSPQARAALQRAMGDTDQCVRVEAAGALVKHGETSKAIVTLAKALESTDLASVLHAARTIELLGAAAQQAAPAMRATAERLRGRRPQDTPATVVQPGDLDMSMFIGFSTSAFLAKLDAATATEGERDDGWTDLFDGKTLNGWNSQAGGENVQVAAVDGEIHILSRGKNFWLAHERVWGDFELEAEARMPQTYNSGIGFRCRQRGRFTGYQCEIDQRKSGAIYAIGRGWVWPQGKDQTVEFKNMAGESFRTGEWNHFRVRCVGSRLQVWVNGVQTADVRDDQFDKGLVALQHHGKGDVHRFRKIRIRPIASK